jgi:Mlc titration factor MtfA (ptsG expression regulator)
MSLIDALQDFFRRKTNTEPRIDDDTWRQLIASSRLFEHLDIDSQSRLRVLSERFLAKKSFSAAAGHALDDSQCLAIAALACLPVLNLGFDWLEGWSEIIVYPGEFRVRREHHDEHSGVITESEDELIGEAWERGPVILSWADVAADLEHPFDGFNVVIHEIAHKLDMLDGAMNGVPQLPASITRKEWIATMQVAFEDFVRAIDVDEETSIDPYAAESPEEFFAVLSELHFSEPASLVREMADTARLLEKLYGSRHAERI